MFIKVDLGEVAEVSNKIICKFSLSGQEYLGIVIWMKVVK